jgi:hypothetical protein
MTQEAFHVAPIRALPDQLASLWPATWAKSDLNASVQQVVKGRPGRPQLFELLEDQPHHPADLFIRILDYFSRGELNISHRHAVEQLSTGCLVPPATLESVAQRQELRFAESALQAQKEAVVGICRIVDPVLIGQKGTTKRTHLKQPVPVG